jgi:hypothetical protein
MLVYQRVRIKIEPTKDMNQFDLKKWAKHLKNIGEFSLLTIAKNDTSPLEGGLFLDIRTTICNSNITYNQQYQD